MPLVRLVSWNTEAARMRARLLRRPGLKIDATPLQPSGMVGHLRDLSPTVVVIDLDRLPSHGLAVGIVIRDSKSVRSIPIVFAGGAPEKIARVRGELPDAAFTPWENAAAAVAEAVRAGPTVNPVRPKPHMERYAGSSLARKLGLKPQTEVALLGAPDGFEEMLRELADGTGFTRSLGVRTALVLWFVRSRREVESETAYLTACLPEGCGLWIVYPKQSGRYKVDFKEGDVRAAGLKVGMVDFKICAVDQDWTGLRFAWKKSGSGR
jgi:hypothetical protein